jgi:hypothetical protein
MMPNSASPLATNSLIDQLSPDIHMSCVDEGTISPQAVLATAPRDDPPAGPQSPPPANNEPIPMVGPPVVDPLLFVHATAHNDLEQQRIASENRLRQLIRGGWDDPRMKLREEDGQPKYATPDDLPADEDGEKLRGFGLTMSNPDVARLAGITDALRKLENDAKLGMCRALRRGSIHPWVKAQIGLGEKQIARLLSAIGDPYWHTAEDRPRTVSELWAYSGLHVLPIGQMTHAAQMNAADGDPPLLPASHGDNDAHRSGAGGELTSDPGHLGGDARTSSAGVAAKRRRGVRSNWSTDAKTRAYLCAASCIKQARSPYRTVYVGRRAHTAITHPEWTPGHSHNDALRIASKAILRDLWREAKRLHEEAAP